jgi:hypothetical protein
MLSLPIVLAFATAVSSASQAPRLATAPTGTLTLVCPEEAKVFCPTPTTPNNTGVPTVTSTCDPAPNLTYSDSSAVPMNCAADRFQEVITRTWTATDSCGNTATCVQIVIAIRQIWDLDILPGTCPNTIDLGGNPNDLITMSISGAPGEIASTVIASTVQLWLDNCAAGPVTPVSVSLDNLSTPTDETTECSCQPLGPDGLQDVRLRFRRGDLISILNLAQLPNGTQLRLNVTGTCDCCTFVASDCITIQSAQGGDEGCTLGYWKNHASSWGPTGYTPSMDFDTVFGVNAFTPNRTLMQALRTGGGGLNNLGRQGTAALLNTAHPGVDFPLSAAQVIESVRNAVLQGNAGPVASYLDGLNNLGCPLN